MAKHVTIEARTSKGLVAASEVLTTIRALLHSLGGPEKWKVRSMHMGSPLSLDLAPVDGAGPAIAEALHRRLHSAVEGKKLRGAVPATLSAPLAKLHEAFSSSFTQVCLSVGRKRAVLFDVHHVEAAAGPGMYVAPTRRAAEIGEVSGYFERLSAPLGEASRFAVRDRVSGRQIECVIREDDRALFDQARESFKQLVTVHGRLHFGVDGLPARIEATELTTRPRFVIPYDEWQPMNITGGIDATSYVRKVRNAK